MRTKQLKYRERAKSLVQPFLWLCAAALFFAIVGAARSAEDDVQEITGISGKAKYKAKVNFRAMADAQAQAKAAGIQFSNRTLRAIPAPYPHRATNDVPPDGDAPAAAAPSGDSGLMQPQGIEALAAASPQPASSFQALDDNLFFIPPDTAGAVGPNHVMTTLNSQVRIQDRQGNILSTVDLDTFWSPLNFPATFDPEIVYDPYTSRWFFSAGADAPQGTNFFF